MSSFDAGSIVSTARVDRTQAIRDLDELKADVAAATQRPAEFKVTLDDTDARRKFDQLKTQLSAATGPKISINLDTAGALRQLDDLKAKLSAASGPTIKVNLDTASAITQLNNLKAQLSSTSGSDIRMNVSIAGSASVLSELARLDEAAGRLDGRDINIRVNAANASANSALADTAARATALGSLSPTITPSVNPGPATSGLGQIGAASSSAGSAMDALIGIAVLLAPALVPIGVAALGATAGLVSMATAGGAAAGIFGAAVLGAVKATQANSKALDQSNTALASAQQAYQGASQAAQAAAQGVASAKDAVTAAQAAVGDAANAAARSVQQARDNVVQAQQAVATASQQAAKAVQSANDGVVTAEAAVGKASQQAAQQVQSAKDSVVTALQQQASANQSVINAEFALGQAQETELEAQQALTQARVDAQRAIEDMNASLDDAQLSERGDKLAVQEAQLALTKATAAGSTATSLQRQEAQLAYDEAVQHLSEQSTKTQRLQTDTAAANKAGVDGSTQVAAARKQDVSATNGVVSATQQLAAAQQSAANAAASTAKAQKAVTDAQQTGADNVKAAQQALAKAQQAVTDAQVSGAASVLKAQQALAQSQQGVTDAQVNGAKQVAAAQQGVKKAQEGVAQAQQAAAQAGQAAAAAGAALAAAQEKQSKAAAAFSPIERVLSASFTNLKNTWAEFIGATEKQTLTPVITVVNALAAALPRLEPVVKAVAPLAQKLADAFANWVTGNGLKRATDFITTNGVPILAHFSDILRNLLTVGGNMVRVFAPMGVSIAAALDRGSASMAKWSNTGGFQNFLKLVQQVGPSVRQFLSALGAAMQNVFQAVSNLGPASMLGITGLLKVIANTPPGVLSALIVFFGAYKTFIGVVAIGNVAVGVWNNITRVARGLAAGWAAAQWLLNFAFAAFPLTTIIIGIVALIAIIVLIATKTTWFQTAWKYTWNAIKQVASDVWGFLQGKFGLLIALIGPVGWILAIASHWSAVWGEIKQIASDVWGWLQDGFHAFVNFFTTLWNNQTTFWKDTFDRIWGDIKQIATNVWSALQSAFHDFVSFISNLWNQELDGLKIIFNTVWGAIKVIASDAWNWIKAAFQAFIDVVRDAWNTFLNALKTGAQAVWDAIKKAASTFADDFKKVFKDVVSAIGTIWNGLKATLAKPINFLIDSVYTHGIKAIWDNTAGKIGLPPMPDPPAELKFASGGIVPGVGVGDTVPALLTPGERVLSRDQVAMAGGHDALDNVFGKSGGSMQSDGKVHAKLGFSIPNPITVAKKAINGVKDLGKFGLDKIHQLAGDVIYDVAKPILNTFKTAIHAAAPKTPKAAHDIPVGATDKVVAQTLTFLKGQQDSAKAADAQAAGTGTTDPGEILKYAISISQGKPYVLGGVGPDNFDCSGLVQTAYEHFGIATTRTSESQYAAATPESASEALPGDLVFENFPGEVSPGHVGIFAGPGRIWNANSPSAGIRYDNIQNLIGYGRFTRKSGLIGSNKPPPVADQPAGSGVARWASVIQQALAAAGLPASYTNQVETQMQTESGGDPNAVNNTDSNATQGTPSEGLMQVIQPTFDYYAGQFKSRGLLDPLANIYAAIKYAQATYGPTMINSSGQGLGSGQGYATGTMGAAPGWAWVGENGPELLKFKGGETVVPNHAAAGMAAKGLGGYASGTLASSIDARLSSATKTTAADQSKVNSLQNQYDQQHLNAVYAKTKAEQAAAAAEAKVTAARLAAAKHLLAQAKASEAQLSKDYAAATKVQTAQANATAATFTSWLNAQKATLQTQIDAATQLRNNYLQSAQGAAPSLTGLNTFTAIAGAFKNSTTTLNNVASNVQRLKARGVSAGLINAILSMDPADALTYTNTLLRTDSNGIAAADSAFAGYDAASEAYATTGADVTGNFTAVTKQGAALGSVAVTVESPKTLTVKLPDGSTVTGTVVAEERRVEAYLAKLTKDAAKSKR